MSNGPVSTSLENRIVEYVDPVTLQDGRYMPPTAPGYSITMKPESLRRFSYPDGPAWTTVDQP
jgi:L-fuconate dehydratase